MLLRYIPLHVYNLIANKVVMYSVTPHFHCSTCQLAKQNKLYFTNLNHFTPNLFDFLHINNWDLFREHTYDDFQYFLS